VKAIVAVAANDVIGSNNQMPWHLPKELQYFKKLTTDHHVVMGKQTYLSILKQLGKPLPNRQSMVLSKSLPDQDFANVAVFRSKDALLDTIARQNIAATNIFVIGGNQIFKQFESDISSYYITRIDRNFDGDCFFQLPRNGRWKLQSSQACQEQGLTYYQQLYAKV